MEAMQGLHSVEITAISNTLPRYDFKLIGFPPGVGMAISARGRGVAGMRAEAAKASATAPGARVVFFHIGVFILLDFRSPPANPDVSERREDGCRRAVR